MGALPPGALALAALLGVCSAVLEVHVGTGSVFSVEGQGVVLPAWYTSRSQKKPYVTWLLDKADADPFQILTYLDGVVKVEETELKPRVGFLYPVLTHNISVFINATRERDSGQYMCTVNVVDDATSTGKNVAVINLTVLVPPAPPACRLRGSPTVGANVTLSCASEKGKPSPAYQWQRTAPTLQVFFPPAQGKVGLGVGGSPGKLWRRGRGGGAGVSSPELCLLPALLCEGGRRVSIPLTLPPAIPAIPRWVWGRGVAMGQHPNSSPADRARGTLKLTNLSLDMSGLYVCVAENQAGSAECSIILEVHSSDEGAIIAGAVLGSLGALATVAFFARRLVSYRRKKRDGQEEAANEIKEDAVAPKTPSWTRTPPADAISKTSTLSSVAGARDRPYGASPPSDTASVLTAAGSYRGPPRAGGRPPPTNGAPWHPPQAPGPPGGLPPSSLTRAGAIPVMVPAQSRAGSLV
ncbi:endothelial cell-selective adhesion molecule isoform X1 [Cygnus atratus]|uniref:endothelial cell-selective adhesion molecule isoform X1 n=1 Tax=Cygnus atratus TaxID=8868 RepID=UPI0021B7BE6A|nr:endothelial cell-selective adhesion molecule isoform X1 [Cygnus atratus]